VKRILTVLAVTVMCAVGLAPPTQAAAMTCQVQSPISAAELNAGATWYFEVFNAQPNVTYLAKVNWPGDPSNGGHYNAGIITDSTGYGISVLERWWRPDGFLPGGWPNGYDPFDPLGSFVAVPGAFSVQVGPKLGGDGGTGGKANCDGEVLP
jgi:hypothetical protein